MSVSSSIANCNSNLFESKERQISRSFSGKESSGQRDEPLRIYLSPLNATGLLTNSVFIIKETTILFVSVLKYFHSSFNLGSIIFSKKVTRGIPPFFAVSGLKSVPLVSLVLSSIPQIR